VWMGFRPEAVEIGPGPGNSLATTIGHVSYLGEIEQYELALAQAVAVKAFEQNPQEIRRVGESLTVHIRPQNLLVLPV
jgi:ABC-type Fe3+/spermidine/putrescine transport system ATPase subunit